jgi:hypothetical protein
VIVLCTFANRVINSRILLLQILNLELAHKIEREEIHYPRNIVQISVVVPHNLEHSHIRNLMDQPIHHLDRPHCGFQVM